MESGTIKLCTIQLEGLAFYKARCKYYVKDTTLRLLCNMSREDLHDENNNGWVGCKTRNQAKRLIAINRKNIRYQKSKQIMSADEDWLKYMISFEKGKPFKCKRPSFKDIKEFGKKI